MTKQNRVVIRPREVLEGAPMQQASGGVRDLKLIYPETGFDAKTLCLGVVEIDPGHHSPLHRHNCEEVYYVIQLPASLKARESVTNSLQAVPSSTGLTPSIGCGTQAKRRFVWWSSAALCSFRFGHNGPPSRLTRYSRAVRPMQNCRRTIRPASSASAPNPHTAILL